MNLAWPTLAESVVQAIAATLRTSLPGMRVQTLEELSDGVQDTPLLQVHWYGDDWDPHGGGETDRTTFRGFVKQVDMSVQLWAFLRQRSLVGEDQAEVVRWGDRIRAVLLAQGETMFGTIGAPRVRACGFKSEPVVWTTGGERRFAGVRYTLSLRIY